MGHKNFIILLVLSLSCACTGDSGGGSSGLQFQEGLAPKDIAGTYKMDAPTVSNNSCGGHVSSDLMYLKLEQEGTNLAITNLSDADESYTGEVSGSSFRVNEEKTLSDENCAAGLKNEMVGTVSGDLIDITIVGTMKTAGDCGDAPDSCSIVLILQGKRTNETGKITGSVQSSGKGYKVLPFSITVP